MNGTEPGNRGRGCDRRESPYALGSAGQRRQPGAKVSWDKFRGGGRSGPVLRQKAEWAPALPGVGLLGLRLPVPSRSRLSLIPVALVLPVACSQISLLFLHGDPPKGKRRCEATCSLLREWLCGLVARTLRRACTARDVLEPQYPLLGDGGTYAVLAPSACLFASARRCLDQITVKVLTGQKIFRF